MFKKENKIIKKKEIDLNKNDLHFEIKTEVNKPKKQNQKKIDNNRCHFCNKKLKIFNTYSCKCNYNFCEKHRYRHMHNCTIDKNKYKDKIKTQNPLIECNKLIKIN